MMQLRQILQEQARAYPLMTPQDAVKLIYQNEFGNGHLIGDPNRSLEDLRQESAQVAYDPSAPLFQEIGNGAARVQLTAVTGERYALEALNRDFYRSADAQLGTQERFYRKLSLLRDVTAEGLFAFDTSQLQGYLAHYLAAGCPPVSHSEVYRQAYHPAYRVVLTRFSLPYLLEDIQRRLADGQRLVVGIDGRCASGKTTLAKRLAGKYGWSVVHMDHFYLRPDQRTPARYATPGENVDHERFSAEVLQPLKEGKSFSYRPFDCQTMDFAPPVQVEASPVTLVEGSYSCHPVLWDAYDLHVFLSISTRAQIDRITTREGHAELQAFQTRWIPMEEAYFKACGLKEKCEYSIETA